MRCDLTGMHCEFKSFSNHAYMFPLTEVEVVDRIKCANPDFTCDEGQTCCRLYDGNYGCCPYESAQCCADGRHCCPHGTTCDVQQGRCVSSQEEVVNLTVVTPLGDANVCPDPSITCPPHTTCCQLKEGYGCCPLPEAVCCADGAHCCPHATLCDAAHGRCSQPHSNVFSLLASLMEADHESNMLQLQPPLESSWQKQHFCPNLVDQCLDGQTCCLISETDYGCCPFSKAVCCSDLRHCCPEDTVCDMPSDACRPHLPLGNATMELIRPFP